MVVHLMHLAASPWIYLLVFAAVAVDAFLPVIPSETLVIGLGALSVHGTPTLTPLVLAVVAGGMTGDRISYAIGRRAGTRLAAVPERARQLVQAYGGLALIAGRFVPGGRTTTTLAAGSTGLSPARFRVFTALAGAAWAAYAIGIGRLGGVAFRGNPLIGATIGIAIGLLTAAVFHLIQRRRPAARPPAEPDEHAVTTPSPPSRDAMPTDTVTRHLAAVPGDRVGGLLQRSSSPVWRIGLTKSAS